MPRAKKRPIKVTIKGSTFKKWIIQPNVNPNTIPTNNIKGITTIGLAPFANKEAEAAEVMAIMPATERSIPLEMITRVIPMETIIRLAVLINRLKNTCGFCMAG